MVGKLNVSKNQYTKSITIPPVAAPKSLPPEGVVAPPPISQPTQNTTKTPTKTDVTLPNTRNESENKKTVNTPKDESLLSSKPVDIDFPYVTFDSVSFEVTDGDTGSESMVLPEPSEVQTGNYTPISGVKQRSVKTNNMEENSPSNTSRVQGVQSNSLDQYEHGVLKELSSNRGINIIVRGDNATITVSNNSDSTNKATEDALPTLKDIKNATTLNDLLHIEERYAETLKYLEAKKLVLDIENKIK